MILGLGDVVSELQTIERHAARRARQASRVLSADAETARRANRLAGWHVGMQPGVVLALAEAGFEPFDPVALEAARRSDVLRARSALGWRSPGERVPAAELASRRRAAERADMHAVAEREEQSALAGSRGEAQAALQADRRPASARRPGESREDWFARIADPGVVADIAGGSRLGGGQAVNLKGAVRGAGMLLNAPLQEVQGQFRNVVEDVGNVIEGDLSLDLGKFGESQSDLGVAIDQRLRGEQVDVGSGFFVDPRSDVARERLRRERERGLIGGHVITPGRWVANLVTEPGSTEFNVLSGLVDAGVALKADPSAAALGNVGRSREARRLFTADPEGILRAGGLRGRRPTTVADQVNHWLDTEGSKVIDYLAAETDFGRMRYRTGKKLPVRVVTQLQDARTTDEVRDILRPLLGVQIREKPELVARPIRTGLNVTLGGSKGYVRLAQTMPARRIDLQDADDAVEQIDRFLRNAKIGQDRISEITERMARAHGDRNFQYQVLTEAMDEVAAAVGRSRARRLTQMFVDSEQDARRYFVDAVGGNVRIPGAVVSGNVVPEPIPHLFVEALGRYAPLPDARNIRSAMSFMGRVQDIPGVATSSAVGQWVNQRWKEWALLRFAYPVRVIGEEQVRMAAAGLSSMFSHPASYLSYLVGRKGGADVFDNAWDDIAEFRQALNRGSAGWRDETGFHRTRDWVTYDRASDHYLPSWGDELGELYADPVVQKVARTDDLADVKAWWWDGDGQGLRHMLMHRLPELNDRRVAEEYIDSIVERISVKTGGDSRLLDVVRGGVLNGVRISDDGATLNKKFVQELRGLYDEGVGPERVKGARRIAVPGGGTSEYDRFIEWSFGWLMSKPTNWLSRSKTFEQMYWKRMAELVPFMDEATQAAAIGRARALNLDSFADEVPGLRRIIGRDSVVSQMERRLGQGAGTLSLADADVVAKGWALDKTKWLLYDMAERNQFFDAMRLITPFGDAWKEVLTRWAALVSQNPRVLRRAQQTIQEARSEGWFYENEFGDEVFNYPGSAWVSERVTGVPIPLTGRVEGLSLATNVIPGVGPVVQIPAGFFIEKYPELDTLWETLFPFGPFEAPTELRSWAPPWMEKGLTAFAPTGDMERMRANTTMDIATYLVSTGDYDITGPGAEDEIDRLMSDAKSKARLFLLFRGAAQSTLPAAPSPEMVVRDRDGNVQVLSAMRDHWQALLEEHDFDSREATGVFLDAYGADLALVMQGKTHGVIFGVPVTKEGEDWGRANRWAKRKFPNVWGYFAPPGGEFDYNAYLRAMNEGARDQITPEQHVLLANARVAAHLYERRKSEIEEANKGVGRKAPTPEQRAWLAQVKRELIEDFPGYERALGLRESATTAQQIEELQRAVRDDRLAETEVGEALSIYFDLRDQAAAAAEEGTTFQKSKANLHLRDWLRSAAADLREDFTGFGQVWDRVLERELNEDLEEQ